VLAIGEEGWEHLAWVEEGVTLSVDAVDVVLIEEELTEVNVDKDGGEDAW
jgi:hypothetical protein